jgi:arabinogalactan oligomer/maltooligosaccharide transport system permease protein
LMAGLGFGVALLITQPGIRGKTVFRTLILVPWAFPAFITILIWKNLLDQHFGAVNQVLSLLFHVSPNWTGSVPLAMISVILVNLWLSLAYYTFVYTASLQSIPQELYDAAQMDGYGTLSRVRNIVIPLLSRQIAFITIFGFIFAWSNFYIPYLLTSGEPGISTQILITYSYTEAFSYLSYGVAAVYSIISVLILLVMVIIVNHYSKMMSILY